MVMTTRFAEGSLRSRWLGQRGFAKLAGTWFGALVGVYAIYALIAFLRLEPHIPMAYRAIMVLGPTTMAVALLASAATYAASVMRFDLLTASGPKRRRVYWVQLALFGLGAYLLVAVGAPAVRSMLPGASNPPAESFPQFATVVRGWWLLVPGPFGAFAVLSGLAGALVGQITSRSVQEHARAVPWLVCLGLVGGFVASFLGTSSLIVQRGFPSVAIILMPVMVPLIVVTALAWRERRRDSRSLRRPGELSDGTDRVDPEAVDEVLSRVIESCQQERHPTVPPTVSAEAEVAELARSIRRVAGSRPRMSPSLVTSVVEHLVTQDRARVQPQASARSSSPYGVSELCSAWVSMAVGFLVVGLVGGLVPSFSSVVVAGIAASVIVAILLRGRRRTAHHPAAAIHV